jgi:hypothetical protein
MDLAELPAVVPVAEVLRAAAEPLPSLDDRNRCPDPTFL